MGSGHDYLGWRDGHAPCSCGRRFDSVQEFDAHLPARMTGREQSADRGARVGAELRASCEIREIIAIHRDDLLALLDRLEAAEAKVARVEALFACGPHGADQADWPEGCFHCQARLAIRGALGEQGATSAEASRLYLDRLEKTNPSAEVQAVIDNIRAEMDQP